MLVKTGSYNIKETLINTFLSFFKMYSKAETRTFLKTTKRMLRFDQLFPKHQLKTIQKIGTNTLIYSRCADFLSTVLLVFSINIKPLFIE